MTDAQIVLFGIIFASASMAAMIVLTRLAGSRTRRRLDRVSGKSAETGESGDKDAWLKTAIKLSGPFARLSLPKEGWERSKLRLRFMNAGVRGEEAPLLYFGAKTLLTIGLPVIAFFALRYAVPNFDASRMVAVLFVAAVVGNYLPNFVLSRLIFYRQRSVFENFPDAADLLLVCIEAGLGLDAALNKVAEEMRQKSGALAEELQLVNLEMRAGATREKALQNLATRTGVEEVKTFATMLVQADRFGTSIGSSLRVFSDELRTRRKFRAEELAAKIPLKLLFPLVFFIFPSLLLVLLGPAFIQIHHVLLPIMSGGQ